MMKIKYRGKRKDNSEWVYGYYVLDTRDSEPRIITNTEYSTGTYFQSSLAHRIIPETIGLFTGRKDMNDKEIYQGHLLKSKYDGSGSFVEVKYGEHLAYCIHDDEWMTNIGFYVKDKYGTEMPLGCTESWAVIIGDVHA